ncbi:PAS domain S-box protein [Rossellomorea sp. BNER]|uniref:PAS domain-containing protein n=1 Tax=Rossellomorea sp. BNER TaxID=2962031 RepID=UPI003AF2829C|nr:PAS domain S-box protein [Rossellomorea sp. BNER]
MQNSSFVNIQLSEIPYPTVLLNDEFQIIESNEGWIELNNQHKELYSILVHQHQDSILSLNEYQNTISIDQTLLQIKTMKKKPGFRLVYIIPLIPSITSNKELGITSAKDPHLSKMDPLSKQAIYESLIVNSPTYVCVIDDNKEVLEVNPSFREKFQLNDDFIGAKFLEHPLFIHTSFSSLIQEGFNGRSISGIEETFPLPEGGECTLSITVSPANYNENGSIRTLGLIMHDITDKKKFQKELLSLKVELENTLKLQKTITYKFIKQGEDFIITMAAGELLQKMKYQTESIVGKSIQEVFDANHFGKRLPMLQKVWETGMEITYEDVYRHMDYIASVVPVIKEGKVFEIICSITDVSPLKDAQKKLEEKEQKYRSIVNYNPDNIFFIDTNGIIQEINPTVETQMKMAAPKEMIGLHFSSILAEGYIDEALYHFEESLKGEPQRYYTVINNADDTMSHISVSNIPVRINGEVIGIYLVGRDITEKTKIEEELIEAKELLEAYFEHAGDGIALLDPEGNVLKVNHHFEKMFGFSKEEVTGQHITFIHSSEQVHQFKQNLKVVKQGKRIKDFETVRYRKDKTPVYISFNMNPILNEKGNLMGISAIIRDLSEKKKNEDLLKKSEQLAMIGQLAAGVAHEIRNPLTTLKGFLQLIKEQANDDFYLEVIQGEIERIEIITNEFLALAKPRAVHYTANSLTSLLTNSVEFIKMECLKQGVDVKFSVKEAMIYCNPHEIKQVILNVMKNALEAMPKGGLLEVILEKNEQFAKLIIQDTGDGISPERMKHLGEPFYSTKEKGTGLGLMICQKIIKEHHGAITINSKINQGTRVEISIPLAQGKNEEK